MKPSKFTPEQQAVHDAKIVVISAEIERIENEQRHENALAEKKLDREAGALQAKFEAEFANYTTARLLRDLRSHYRYEDYYYRETYAQRVVDQAKWWALKKVLARRPHLLNKLEGRKKRQKEALRNRGNSKGRNR